MNLHCVVPDSIVYSGRMQASGSHDAISRSTCINQLPAVHLTAGVGARCSGNFELAKCSLYGYAVCQNRKPRQSGRCRHIMRPSA